MRDHDAQSDENCREEQVHAHPVDSSERQIVRSQKDHQSRTKPVQIVETYGHKKQHRKRQHKRDLHPQPVERILSAHGRAGPDKRSINCVSGKMKNPPMTAARIDAFGVTQVLNAADTSQITELTSYPQ